MFRDEDERRCDRLDFGTLYQMDSFPTTAYFRATRERLDRSSIKDAWILRVIADPDHRSVQSDGRLRMWKAIPEMGHRVLRVILLQDGKTVHNAFFDRSFRKGSA